MKRDAIKNYAAHEESLGIETGPPEGNHPATIVKAEVRETEDGRPFTYLETKAVSGPYENRHIFDRLEWFVDPEWDTADETKKMVQGIIRGQTRGFMTALFGKQWVDAPKDVEEFGPDDDYDEVARVMKTWVKHVVNLPVTVNVKHRKDKDTGEKTAAFPNLRYSARVEDEVFSL